MRRRGCTQLGWGVSAFTLLLIACQPTDRPPPPLSVFAAGALGPPFRAYDSAHPGAELEFSASLSAVRKLTDLGRVPDVLASADLTLLDSLVLPAHSSWYVVFGTNALVLAYGPQVQAPDAGVRNSWWQALLTPGVRVGRSDPRTDPSGYRTLLAVELAARQYGRPGLRDSLLAQMPERHVRATEADLSALLEAGELDFVWTYRNLARAHGLRWLELPDSINLSESHLADWYATASVALPAAAGRTLTVRGGPIEFGATIPAKAPQPARAAAWLKDLVCGNGRAPLAATGFTLLPEPRVVGVGAPEGIACDQ